MEYLKEEQLTNASLHTCDFQSLDLDKEGYRKAFDLVFSSMTPALRGMDNLKKSMEMSRGWCCHVTHLSGRNYLREQILWELFGKKPVSPWNGQSFYALFNILFLSGYNPETTYESRRQEIWVTPDEEYVDFLMEHMLPQEEITKAHAKQIRSWLQRHQKSGRAAFRNQRNHLWKTFVGCPQSDGTSRLSPCFICIFLSPCVSYRAKADWKINGDSTDIKQILRLCRRILHGKNERISGFWLLCPSVFPKRSRCSHRREFPVCLRKT